MPQCSKAIKCLGHFAEVDPHAEQYQHTVKAILDITEAHARKQEDILRKDRKRASAALFGMFPEVGDDAYESNAIGLHESVGNAAAPLEMNTSQLDHDPSSSVDWTAGQGDVFALPWLGENDLDLQSFLQPDRGALDGDLAGIPLFPMYDQRTAGSAPNPH
jgi:hypothetical protein